MTDNRWNQKGKTRAEELKYISAQEKFNKKIKLPPEITDNMVKSVSAQRREVLHEELQRGYFREAGSQPQFVSGKYFFDTNHFVPELSSNNQPDLSVNQADPMSLTNLGVVQSGSINKTANLGSGPINTGSAISSSFRGVSNTVQQVPELYSPLWLNSNLNLPRDRVTVNAWSRSFFALNPIVQNAISLHSTYPISKLNIKSKNRRVEQFFADMIEEIDLLNICIQIAQEFWTLGEAFVYAELDPNKAKWSRLLIQNPDYISVERSAIAGEPIISLRPDQNLRRIVNGTRPSDLQQRRQLSPEIIEYVRRGQNIPLNNFNVHHLARKISPYEVRGTGLIASCFRSLCLFDKLKECYSHDTEVLTDKGFKTIDQLLEFSEDIEVNENYVNGIGEDYNGNLQILKMKEDFKVACVNPKTNEIEYHKPIEMYMSKYNGKMIHFHGEKIDILVSPNHKMWAKENLLHKENKEDRWGDYEKIPASKLLEKKTYWKFKSYAKYNLGNDIKTVNVLEKEIPIELYLKFLGCVISKGCAHRSKEVSSEPMTQLTSSDCCNDMRNCFEKFTESLGISFHTDVSIKDSDCTLKEKWEGRVCNKILTDSFIEDICADGRVKPEDKAIPRWVLDLKPELLKIMLDALVFSDESEVKSKYNKNTTEYMYSTISKQLADDIYEIAYKLNYVPNIRVSDRVMDDGRSVTEYIVLWSNTHYDREPLVYSGKRSKENVEESASVDEVEYNGVVWCFEVPTGLFVTRRNGKITTQGNSKFTQADSMVNPTTLVKIGNQHYRPTPADLEQWRNVFEQASYDKNHRIFSHDAVDIQRVGFGQGIYDIQNDIQQCIKEIYIGLMVPSVLMDGTDTTYANGSVALDVLRQRYMAFRNMLSSWLKNKIFAPISHINDFYEYIEGEKVLIVPSVDWNHMSLFDMNDHISNLMNLAGQGQGPGTNKVSYQTIYRSLGLEYEDELRKMRYEDIQETIRQRELESLNRYSLSELRALGPHDEIEEVIEPPVPGQVSPFVNTIESDEGGDLGGLSGLGGPSSKPSGPKRPRPPMGAGGAPPKGPGGAPKKPGAPPDVPPGFGGAPPPPV